MHLFTEVNTNNLLIQELLEQAKTALSLQEKNRQIDEEQRAGITRKVFQRKSIVKELNSVLKSKRGNRSKEIRIHKVIIKNVNTHGAETWMKINHYRIKAMRIDWCR